MTSTISKPVKEPSASVNRYMLGGLIVVFSLFGGIGVWAARTNLSGAVLAGGLVVVDSNVKKVQHPTGGVVGEIMVKNGQSVKAGDLLMRLDETVTRANLRMVADQLDELAVRSARLRAERDGLKDIPVPDILANREDEEKLSAIMKDERKLFDSRRDMREGQKAQLRERISQLKEEIEGISGQIESKGREIQLIGQELAGLETLEEKRLVPTSKMVALRREAARLEGERGQLQAEAAKAKGKITETELQILSIDQDFVTELMKELRDNQAKEAEFSQKKVAAEDQLKRVDIRAPQSGLVHQLQVHTVGGVINPAEPVMMIVPEGDQLVIEARIAPHDIDQVLISDRSALVRFSAFSQRTTPELVGHVKSISPDLTMDQKTGESYFVARIEIPETEIVKLGEKKLVPGMPADVQIKTQDRTALSYLLKPMTDQISKAFRER